MTTLVVAGTGTGVGKTVVAAAVLALARGHGAYVKPVQTGVPGDVPDVDVVARLTGAEVHEFVRYAAPLSPEAAARHEGAAPADVDDIVRRVERVDGDLVVVEGAGGLLVRYDARGTTFADLAVRLRAPVLLVVGPELGTLNATALTLEAMSRRGLDLAGVVVGSWPAHPGIAELSNLYDLAALAGQPLAGVVPAGADTCPRDEFRTVAATALSARFGGRFKGVQ